jgi:hypothetical protein
MTDELKPLPKWILIVSGFFAFLEIMVSIMLVVSPQSVVETLDVSAQGVISVVHMWAARQFALGVIFGFAAWKRSAPMLTIAYLFFFVMFVGDFAIGLSQKDFGFVASAVVMCLISSAMMYRLNKR